MPLVKNEDNDGGSTTCAGHKGKLWPPIPGVEDNLDNLEAFAPKDGDVWIAAFPKCGTHWCWDIVAMLQRSEAVHHKEVKEKFMLEFNPIDSYKDIPAPRVLNSHLLYTEMPSSVKEAKSKTIVVVRNPKDACVSFYNHHRGLPAYNFDGKFSAFFDLVLRNKVEYGMWFDYHKDWWDNTKDSGNVLWLYYEEMIQDLRSNIEKIAKFVNLHVGDDKLLGEITEACTFAKMKEAKLQADLEFYGWKSGFKHGMYRKGKVGDWKNWFTVAQSEMYDSVFQQEMKGYEDVTRRISFEL